VVVDKEKELNQGLHVVASYFTDHLLLHLSDFIFALFPFSRLLRVQRHQGVKFQQPLLDAHDVLVINGSGIGGNERLLNDVNVLAVVKEFKLVVFDHLLQQEQLNLQNYLLINGFEKSLAIFLFLSCGFH